jgi:hypothetical protein
MPTLAEQGWISFAVVFCRVQNRTLVASIRTRGPSSLMEKGEKHWVNTSHKPCPPSAVVITSPPTRVLEPPH